MTVIHLALLFSASLAAVAVPSAHTRDVTVVNTGSDAIFTLRIGDASLAHWGDDLLGFDGVIDVSRGRTVAFPVDPGRCREDVQATFRGGATVVIPNVNICTVGRLDIGNAEQ